MHNKTQTHQRSSVTAERRRASRQKDGVRRRCHLAVVFGIGSRQKTIKEHPQCSLVAHKSLQTFLLTDEIAYTCFFKYIVFVLVLLAGKVDF